MGGGISNGLRYYFKHFPPQKTSYDFEQNTFSMPSICGEKSHKCVVWLRIVFFGTKSQTNFSCTRINTGNILEVKVFAAAGIQALFLSIFLPRNYFKLKWEKFPMSGKWKETNCQLIYFISIFPSTKCTAKLNKASLVEEEKSFTNSKITYRIAQKTYFADSFYI